MFLNVLIFGSLAGLATLLGVFLMARQAAWAQKNLVYLISFSAGVLLSFSFIHLLPEALDLARQAFLIVLLSFLGFYVLEHALSLHVCTKEGECEPHQTFTLVSWVGLLVHSLIDGVIIGVGFELSFALGILSTLAVLLHELPEGISSMAVMLYGGYSLSQAVTCSSAVALATPLGAVVSFVLLPGIKSSFVGALLAIAAGSFLYVAASDLIPEIHKKSRLLNIFLTLLGALVPFAASILLQ
ncbi:MAG TPA: ZIP family metal transporter [Clostridia bacterium]|nr:ZIP family metal transporter [Clostridia bacterium]